MRQDTERSILVTAGSQSSRLSLRLVAAPTKLDTISTLRDFASWFMIVAELTPVDIKTSELVSSDLDCGIRAYNQLGGAELRPKLSSGTVPDQPPKEIVAMWRQLGVIGVVNVLLVACGSPGPGEPPMEEAEVPPEVLDAPEATPTEPVAPPPDVGDWVVNESTNPLDDTTTVVAGLDAAEGLGGILQEKIQLVVRCQSNRTEAFITWHDYLGNDTDSLRSERKRVTYRFPPADATTELWGVSTDNDATFVENPIPFVRQLAVSDRLVTQTTPYGEPPRTAIFDLTGARAALEPISETCEWILDAEEANQARQQREEDRRAERERVLASKIGVPIIEGLGTVGRVGDSDAINADLPAPIGRAFFEPGVTMSQVVESRDSGHYAITCGHGEWEGDEITLRGCTIE